MIVCQLIALVGSDIKTKNVSMLKIPRDLFPKNKKETEV